MSGLWLNVSLRHLVMFKIQCSRMFPIFVSYRDPPMKIRYKPRKPRFFNRVKCGFEWNKYNQTHYDRETPPPKFVQGCPSCLSMPVGTVILYRVFSTPRSKLMNE